MINTFIWVRCSALLGIVPAGLVGSIFGFAWLGAVVLQYGFHSQYRHYHFNMKHNVSFNFESLIADLVSTVYYN